MRRVGKPCRIGVEGRYRQARVGSRLGSRAAGAPRRAGSFPGTAVSAPRRQARVGAARK